MSDKFYERAMDQQDKKIDRLIHEKEELQSQLTQAQDDLLVAKADLAIERGIRRAQQEELKEKTEALEKLVELKEHKDTRGDAVSHWYRKEKPLAWDRARDVLKKWGKK